MNSSWESKPLGELVEFKRGLTYKKADEVPFSETVVLRATNIDLATNALNLSELRYISDTVSVPSGKLVKKNSLLVCTASGSKAHLGKVAMIDEDYGYAFGGFMGMLIPHACVLPKYLFYCLTSPYYKKFIGDVSDGANINNLRFDVLAKFCVPVPPIAEQKRIVKILDKAVAAIDVAEKNTRKNIENFAELFQRELDEALTNISAKNAVETTLGNEVDLKVGFAFKSAEFTDELDDVRLLRGDNIVPGALRWDKAKRYPKEKAAEYEQFALEEGDIVLAMDRPWISSGLKRAQVGLEDLPSLLVQRVARLSGQEALDQRFLYHLISTRRFVIHLVGNQTGLGVPHISGKQISAFEFRKPPIEVQQRIASRLDKLWLETQRMLSIAWRKVEAIVELRRAILIETLSGELGQHI